MISGINDGSPGPGRLDVNLGISSISCRGGYITETSPMGTRVCEGIIDYAPQEKIKGNWYSMKEFGQQCRWR